MKRTIRIRFFSWLAIQTSLIFLSIGFALSAFDFYEYLENPTMMKEELEEIFVITVVMLILFPMSLIGAWLISRRLLRPWQSLVMQAEEISGGHLDERIEVENPDDEIGRLGVTLNTTFDRYQNLLDRLQRFSFDVSHQLRNPLAAIRTNGEVCLKRPRTPEEYVSVISDMLDDSRRLGRTVDQLLMLASAAGGSFDEHRERVCLQDIAREVVQEGQIVGELRSLQVELVAPEQPLQVRAVPDLVREALTNLMDNALRFSPDGGRITVELQPVSSGHIRISVCDSGPGLAPEQKSTIFRPYDRNQRKDRNGVGLGLAIVADICRAHDCRFGVEDHAGGGSVFWIEFPAV